LIAKDPRSGDSNCPAVYRAGDGADYIVVGALVQDHAGLTGGVAPDEVAVRLPDAVFDAVMRDQYGIEPGTVQFEVSADSDVVLVEAHSGRPAGLAVDNGGTELQLVPIGAGPSDRLAAIDKLLSQLSELRVATSEELEPPTQ